MGTLPRAWSLLEPRARVRALGLAALSCLVAVFEAVGVSSVLPFFTVLSSPETLQTDPRLVRLREALGIDDPLRMMVVLGVAAAVLQVVVGAVRAAGTYAQTRFSTGRYHAISARLLGGYLHAPYAFFLNRHAADLSKGVLSEVELLSSSVYLPLLQILAHGLTVVLILTLILVVDAGPVLAAGLVIGGAYALIFVVARARLTRLGADRVAVNQERFTAAGEALSGVKAVKVADRETAYLARFDTVAARYSDIVARTILWGKLPKFAVEALVMGGLLLMTALLIAARSGPDGSADLADIVPTLALLAFAGYRLLPSVHGLYEAFSRLRVGAAALERLGPDLDALPEIAPSDRGGPAPAPLPLAEGLRIEGLGYTYPGASRPSLDDVAFALPAGGSLGIVGTTGAGKTTLVDLLLGLLSPDRGGIRIDGTPLVPALLPRWRRTIGYVPQDVFLMDASVAANIALGVPEEARDMARVRTCARMANLEALIDEMAQGFETPVGDRGLRLSGGQRQRIGIARALYHDPALLVLDEATSALDTVTEAEVMAAIEALQGTKTMVVVAHRLSTVRRCDRILVLDRGRIAGLDGYDALVATNPIFRRLAAQMPETAPAAPDAPDAPAVTDAPDAPPSPSPTRSPIPG
ncbi:MAG: ABC transporter ATP-binding protein [Shimia sp.]